MLPLKLWVFAIAVCFLFADVAQAGMSKRPNKDSLNLGDTSYDWLIIDKLQPIWSISSGIENLISSEEIKKYFELRLKNLISHYSMIENKEEKQKKDYRIVFLLQIEIYKYNETLDIHYGLIGLRMRSNINFSSFDEEYFIINPIAGSHAQIKRFIKDEIDRIVEVLAEDYYLVRDAIRGRYKSKKEDSDD